MNPEEFSKELEAAGVDVVRRNVTMGLYSTVNGRRQFAEAWLKEKEIEYQRERDTLSASTSNRAVRAAELAADAADRAAASAAEQARQAQRANRIAIVALLTAITAAIMSLIALARKIS